MLVRQVVSVNPDSDGAITERSMAEFYLEGDELRAVYHHRGEQLLGAGVAGETRRVWPSEGRAFWDALPNAFATTARLLVRELEVESLDQIDNPAAQKTAADAPPGR